MKKVFVACSRRFYPQVKELKKELDAIGVKGFYPYFDLADENISEQEKKEITLKHFPEISECDVLYVYAKNGYVGYSVTIEVSYAHAKGKEVISSEKISEPAVAALVSKIMTSNELIKHVLI